MPGQSATASSSWRSNAAFCSWAVDRALFASRRRSWLRKTKLTLPLTRSMNASKLSGTNRGSVDGGRASSPVSHQYDLVRRRATTRVLHRNIERQTMWQGTIESINIADGAKEPMRAIAEARAIPGVGLEGDRYALGQGTFFKPEPSHELTLIEAEAIEALSRDYLIQANHAHPTSSVAAVIGAPARK